MSETDTENLGARTRTSAGATGGANDAGWGVKVNMPPPQLNEYSCYDDYKREVKLWMMTSDQRPEKLGPLLAVSLPNISKLYGNKLKTSCLKKYEPEELHTAGGFDKVLKFLDDKLGTTKALSEINAFADIYNYRRPENVGVVEYVSEIDLKLDTLAGTGLILPDTVRAYILLIAAKLNDNQYEIVKGLIDVAQENKVANLYEKIREKLLNMLTDSLGKVVGEATKNVGDSAEAAFIADHEEAFALWKNNKKPWKGKDGGKSSYNQSSNYKGAGNKALNMKDRDGNIMRCRECDSPNHFIRECPKLKKESKGRFKTYQKFKGKNGKVYMCQVDSSEEDEGKNDSDEELYYTAVMYTTDKKDLSRFTAEAINCGALDSCCTCTVTGKKWLVIFLQSLPKDMKEMVKGPYPSGKTFMFGNQGKMTADEAYEIPIKIGGKLHMIKIDVIESDIPLLLSKAEMKNLGMTLDMKNDAAYINGAPAKVSTTSAGHMIMDLIDQDEAQVMEELYAINLLESDRRTQKRMLDKIHRQFGHRTKPIFVSLLKDTNNWLPEFSGMLDKIIDNCEGCIMKKKTPARPSVALPRATDFNEILTMDLKIWEGKYILYMIDSFSRYTVATVIPRKKPNEVVDAIFKHWVKYFGVPHTVMTDNGGEFTGEEMRNVTSYLNVYKDTTGAEAPWMNGLNERNHALADNILRQVTRDYPDMDLATAIAWACAAKNSLSTVYGYSPFQLVFGKNPRLPNVINDPPPSWAIKPQSEALLKHLNAMHATREAFIKAEKCEKLKIALRTKIRTIDRIYKPGDYAFYKRESDPEFKGPAKVIFQDGKIIWLRHGSYCCKVSINRLQPVSDDLAKGYRAAEAPVEAEKSDIKQEDSADTDTNQKTADKVLVEQESSIRRKPKTKKVMNIVDSDHNDADDESDHADNRVEQRNIVHRPTTRSVANDNNADETDEEHAQEEMEHSLADDQSDDEESDDDHQIGDDIHDQVNVNNTSDDNFTDCDEVRESNKELGTDKEPIFIKSKDRVEIKDDNVTDGRWEKATITGRAGKAKTWPDCWNFKLDSGKAFWADIKNLDDIRKMPEEEALAVYTHEHILAVMIPKDKQKTEECLTAKNNELKKLQDFDTYSVVEDKGQKHITCTWVMTQKGDEVRARLTARGFQEEEEIPSDSPTLQKANLRTVLAIAAAKEWTITATDIKSAFLQGSEMTRDVYVKPPLEANMPGKLWKLKKCLYGLRDASRAWYEKVAEKLEAAGFKRSDYDAGLFFLKNSQGKLIGIVGLHVDDFISAGTTEFSTIIIPKVLSIFQVGKSEVNSFLYTGFQIQQCKQGISLNQSEYVSRIDIPVLDAARLLDKESELEPKELTIYRMMVGSTNWVSRASRPDLCFDMVNLSTKFKGGRIQDLKDARKVLTNIVQNDASIMLSNVGNLKSSELWLYTDASFGNLNEGVDSTGAYILLLVNTSNGKCAPLDWKANKVKRVVTSTLAAETLSLYAGLDAAVAMREQLQVMLGMDHSFPITALVDNKSTVDAVQAAVSLTTEKRLRKEIGAVKQMLKQGKLKQLKWVPTQHMLCDALTKKGVNSLRLMKAMQTGSLDREYLESVL
jgi:transposase InsO family protein